MTWVARRYARAHPFLAAQDLLQDALAELTALWRRLHHVKPEADLLRIGARVIYRRMWDAWHDTKREVMHCDALQAVTESRADPASEGDVLLPLALDALRGRLSSTARRILDALLSPDAAMVQAATVYRRTVGASGGNWWQTRRSHVLAIGTQLPVETVAAALQELRRTAAEIFGLEKIAGVRSTHTQGGITMTTKSSKGFVPADLDIDAISRNSPPAAAEEAPAPPKPAKAAVAKAAPPAPAPKAADPAPKAAAPAPVAAADPKPKRKPRAVASPSLSQDFSAVITAAISRAVKTVERATTRAIKHAARVAKLSAKPGKPPKKVAAPKKATAAKAAPRKAAAATKSAAPKANGKGKKVEGKASENRLEHVLRLCQRKSGATKDELIAVLVKAGSESPEKAAGYFRTLFNKPQKPLVRRGLQMVKNEKERYFVKAA